MMKISQFNLQAQSDKCYECIQQNLIFKIDQKERDLCRLQIDYDSYFFLITYFVNPVDTNSNKPFLKNYSTKRGIHFIRNQV